MLKKFCNVILLASLACDAYGACLAGREQALKQGSFSGPLVCNNKNGSFQFLGLVGVNPTYYVYDYRFRFKPMNSSVYHGGQRLVVFDSGGQYLGQYAFTPPPNFDLIIKGTQIIVSINGIYKGAIEFSNGPEHTSHIDDESLMFFK